MMHAKVNGISNLIEREKLRQMIINRVCDNNVLPEAQRIKLNNFRWFQMKAVFRVESRTRDGSVGDTARIQRYRQ